ncbi:MAG: hydroxyacylglutathione hydrolase [Casimicrobiaceae bacterium]|nr:hydroxyacylglutathione hydrolase [Casimicrobiaceae bacterium]MDW8311603.1 hydroxyacylglutathione hydrolase [Burkholderiales bacterium]
MRTKHSDPRPIIEPLPAFADNYIWALRHGSHVAVVDPGDAEVVEAYLAERQLELDAILITHHHGDHVGGVAKLARQHSVAVYGPIRSGAIEGITHPVREGDWVDLESLGLAFAVWEVPGHTLDHVAYVGAGIVFCGDTLFAGGCGRLFEGSAEQLYRSLERLAALEPDTAVYCAHEYTAANLRFAQLAEPENQAVRDRIAEVERLRALGRATLPSSIGLERATNPFLRCTQPGVVASVTKRLGDRLWTPVEVFAALRQWKDTFR